MVCGRTAAADRPHAMVIMVVVIVVMLVMVIVIMIMMVAVIAPVIAIAAAAVAAAMRRSGVHVGGEEQGNRASKDQAQGCLCQCGCRHAYLPLCDDIRWSALPSNSFRSSSGGPLYFDRRQRHSRQRQNCRCCVRLLHARRIKPPIWRRWTTSKKTSCRPMTVCQFLKIYITASKKPSGEAKYPAPLCAAQ